jgi:hypothetical protein
MLLDEKYLYKDYRIQEERIAKWEIHYDEMTQAKKIVELQKVGKFGTKGIFGYYDLETIKELQKAEALPLSDDQQKWLMSQKTRDKDKELMLNLAARRTWGSND